MSTKRTKKEVKEVKNVEISYEAIKNYASSLPTELKVFETSKKAPAANMELTPEQAGKLLAENKGLQAWEIGVYFGLLCHKSDVRFDGSTVKRNSEIKIDNKVYNKTILLKLVNAYSPVTTPKEKTSGNPEALRAKAKELRAKAEALEAKANEIEAANAETAKTIEAANNAAAKVAELGLSPEELKLLLKQLKQVKA